MTDWVPWGVAALGGTLAVLFAMLRGLAGVLPEASARTAWRLWWATLVVAGGILLLFAVLGEDALPGG